MNRERLIPAGLLALLLWIVASLPGEDLQSIQVAPESFVLRIILSDPFMHAFTFALLTLSIAWGFGIQTKGVGAYVRVAVLATGCGLLIEVYQGILPWRTFGLDDLVWNTVGILLCLLALRSLLSQATLEA